MNPLRALLPTAAAMALLAAGSPARADLVRLIDGKTIEGTVSRSGNNVRVKGYRGKSWTFPASEVKFVEAGELSWDVAARMVRDIPSDASDGLFVEKHLEIARYLKERRQYSPELEDLERKEYDLVLRKVPDNEEARLGLGHVRWAGMWFKGEKERDQFRKTAPADQMEPLGYVKYRKTGMWELKEDVEAIEAGKIRYKGRWMTPDEKKEAEGYVRDEKGNWVYAKDLRDRQRAEEVEKTLGEKPSTVTSSDNFRLISWYPVGETAQLKETAEKAYAWVRETVGFPLAAENEGAAPLFTDRIDIFALVDGKRKNTWLDTFGPGYGYDAAALEFYRKGSGWHRLSPVPYFVSSGRETEKNRQRDPEEDFYRVGSHVTSMVGRIVLDRIRPGQTQPWMTEGMGLLTEIRFHETADTCYVTKTEYREDVANKAGSRAKYYDFLKQQVQAGIDRPMRQIFSLDLNNLDWADSVKAWSFLEYLIARHLPEFQQLMRRPFPMVEEITPAHIEAAILARRAKEAGGSAGPSKEEGPIPPAPVRVSGPGAITVTDGSKEQRAVQAAAAEAWLALALKPGLDALEKDWKSWLMTK